MSQTIAAVHFLYLFGQILLILHRTESSECGVERACYLGSLIVVLNIVVVVAEAHESHRNAHVVQRKKNERLLVLCQHVLQVWVEVGFSHVVYSAMHGEIRVVNDFDRVGKYGVRMFPERVKGAVGALRVECDHHIVKIVLIQLVCDL